MAAPRYLAFVRRSLSQYFVGQSSHLTKNYNSDPCTLGLCRLNEVTNKKCWISKNQSFTYERFRAKIARFPVLLAVAAVAINTSEEKEKTKDVDPQRDEIILIIKHAKLAEQKQDFEESEKLYHKALSQLTLYGQTNNWPQDKIIQARVYVYDCMANLALSLGQFQKAENLFKETMRGLLQQGYSKEDNAIVEISLKLAMIYAMLNRLEESENGYQYCVKILEEKVEKSTDIDDDTMALFGLTTDSYSRFLLVQSKLPQALDTMQKALGIAQKVFGDVHSQIAVLYNDIGTVLSLMKEFDSAKEHVLRAVQVAQKVDSPDLPSFLCNLGAVHMHKIELKSAEQACRKALKSADKYQNKAALLQAEKCLEEIKKKKEQENKSK